MKQMLMAQALKQLYRAHSRSPLEKNVAFLSRQSFSPSDDFKMLQEKMRNLLPDWNFISSCYRDSGGLKERIAYSAEQVKLAAQARLIIVDGWNPAVSIPQLRSETHVVQLWHSFGAIKEFGWQIVGKPYGRSEADARTWSMHRNYDCVIASGPGALDAYSKAFDCPTSIIKPMGLPSMDIILKQKKDKELIVNLRSSHPELNSPHPKVLYAPTFRKGPRATEIVQQAAESLNKALEAIQMELFVVSHPVFNDIRTSGNMHIMEGVHSTEVMPAVDLVVTDYSSTAFEAALWGIETMFFCPDIDEYRQANGLNIDPMNQFPHEAFRNASDLAECLANTPAQARSSRAQFPKFAANYLDLPLQKDITGELARLLAETYCS